MARRTSTRTTKPAPAASDLKVTPEEGRIENPPANHGNDAPEVEEVKAEAPVKEETAKSGETISEKVQTSVRERLAKKSIEENIFVPSNPAALEKAAAEVAKEQGFPLNRGTSIGARLIARSQKRA